MSAVLDVPSDKVVPKSARKEPPLSATAIHRTEKCAGDSHPLSVGQRGEHYRLVSI